MASLIRDSHSLLACLMRMRVTNDAVVFWNASREFRVMLRNDPVDEESGVLAFDACILPDDSDDEDDDEGGCPVRRALQLEHDGYDEDGVFVVEAQSYRLEELTRRPDLLDGAVERINTVYNYVVCKCGDYFIKDGAPQCLYCQLTQDSAADATKHLCPICLETGPARHMARQPCCSQMMHSRCLAVWKSSGRNATCPMCRG